jgi:excisionase family DNA binding protein
MNNLLTIDHVSEIVGLTRNTLYAYVSRKKIPYIKMGKLVRFELEELQCWIAEKKVPQSGTLHD